MTYKLNPELGKIISPVTLLFPNGARHEYKSGKAMVEKSFSERYRVKAIKVIESVVEIELEQEIGISDDITFF